MNCSQLLERHATTNWERTTAFLQDANKNAAALFTESIRWSEGRQQLQDADNSRWSEMRSWAIKLTSSPTVAPHFKPVS